jgi:PKD repeat protein
MVKILLKYNNNLLEKNGNFVGYEGKPICNFNASGSSASQISISVGGKLNFYDTSANSTSWNWNFGSGTPSTSTVKNPTGITFNTTGLTSIFLTVSNAFGTDTKTKTDYINVTSSGKKLAININAPALEVGDTTTYYTGVTWTPSGLSERTWTWNELVSNVFNYPPTTGCTMDLKYTDGTMSDYSIITINSVFDDSYNNGEVTGNDTGIYPDRVIRYSFVNRSYPMYTESIRLQGLNSLLTYKLTFFGSRTSYSTTSKYVISGGTNKDGDYVTLDCDSNTFNTVNISGIVPSGSGIIDIGLEWLTNGSAYINAIEIDES